MKTKIIIFGLLSVLVQPLFAQLCKYVDPMIGSEGEGRVVIGPSAPFGMVKPSPDCTCKPNSGWLPMPEVVTGFAQTHVSGTGGGPKYGNILIQPFTGGGQALGHVFHRASERASLGYYATTYQENNITTEITTAARASIYRITYPRNTLQCLSVDAGFFLGEEEKPDAREAQQFVGSEIEVVSPSEIRGYSRIRGGWNNGRAYTVYFCLMSDTPFKTSRTWKGNTLSDDKIQFDDGHKTGAIVAFSTSQSEVKIKIGISFISSLKARQNAVSQIDGFDFDRQLSAVNAEWESILGKIQLGKDATPKQRRIFYTALYHTMLEPVDRTGECPLWNDDQPYYDDYYAIWDTYRTSLPLITLLDENRESDIVRSLLQIYRHDGYMPDARSGNANGRTQGGSNAEVVIADAYVKGIRGIDYSLALDAMLKDATVPPGGNEEQEGRGGLTAYNRLGYVPYGIDRAGNRTVEYSFDDYCIAEVAHGLGRGDIASRYFRQSANWKRLWRKDYSWDGVKGFVMPRAATGEWLDSVTFGTSKVQQPKFLYTPVTNEAPWYSRWWGTFFYEATSWEYSLSIPHDVYGLIEACGGKEAFRKRLDTFFDKGYYNVGNEPSFLSPCLYHWIGRPDLSSSRVRQIIGHYYNDTPQGLPGNDDSGAMSSWLAFHYLGLYPIAGTNRYLVHTPIIQSAVIHLPNGNDLKIVTTSHRGITYNGLPVDSAFITHQQLTKGGILSIGIFTNTDEKQSAGKSVKGKPDADEKQSDKVSQEVTSHQNVADTTLPSRLNWDEDRLVWKTIQNGQTRIYDIIIGDSTVDWRILRNGHRQEGRYVMSSSAVSDGSSMSWRQPLNGAAVVLGSQETFILLSRKAYSQLQSEGLFTYNGTLYRKISERDGTISVKADIDGTEMCIGLLKSMPVIFRISDNPIGIDWEISR